MQLNLNGLLAVKKKHKYDIYSLKKLIDSDDCQLINKIGSWEIELTLESNSADGTNYHF